MLIRSQDKKRLINMRNIISIMIDEDNNVMALYGFEHGWDTLGLYNSEEKAIHILDMIRSDYQYNEECKILGVGASQPEFIFQMPE